MKQSILPLLTFSSLCAAMVGIAPSQEPEPQRDILVDPPEWGVYDEPVEEYSLLQDAPEPKGQREAELAVRVDVLRTRLTTLEAEIKRLQHLDRLEEAKRAQQQAKDLRTALQATEQERAYRIEFQKQAAGLPADNAFFEQERSNLDREQAELHEHLAQLKQEITYLKQAGDLERAEHKALEAEEVSQMLERLVRQMKLQQTNKLFYGRVPSGLQDDALVVDRWTEAKRRGTAVPSARNPFVDAWMRVDAPHADEEGEARVHHLRVAAENLKAAGLHEEAEELAHRAQALAAEQAQRVHGDQHQNPLAGQVAELTDMVHELRGQVFQMREMIEELRAQVRELKSSR